MIFIQDSIKSNKKKKKIYVFRLAIKHLFPVELSNDLENRIISESVRFLGKADKIQIEKDPFGFLEYIKKWLIHDFDKSDLRAFCEILREKFVTRARERDRSLLFLNQKDEGYLYIIHLKQPEDLIDADFKKLIKPGFGKSMILRVFQFMEIKNEYHIHFWEKYNSKILYNCFNIETENYDYSSLVKIVCKIDDFRTILTLSPGKFEDLLKGNKISYDEKEKELILKGIKISVNSLRVMGKNFKLDEFDKFKAEVLKFRDKILMDAEIKKKEFLDLKNNLFIFDEKTQMELKPEIEGDWKKPVRNWKINEKKKYIYINLGEESHKFDKGEMENGLLIFLGKNKRHNLSDSLLKLISYEIFSRTYPGRLFFVFLDYAPHDYAFQIGNFEISNYSGLFDENHEEIKKLQEIFENEDLTEKQKKMIVIAQLKILSESPYYQFQYFAKEVKKRIKPNEKIELKFDDLNILDKTQHVLNDASYETLLEKTLDFGRELERTSSNNLSNSDEDTIRNLFLSMYSIINEIEVTGESRNQYGKTDILLRHNKHNILVIECKKWYGAERFEKGTSSQPGVIDQLFKYISWHESKTLILLFVTKKSFQKVLNQIPNLMEKHGNYRKSNQYINNNLKSNEHTILYTFKHPRDDSLELKIALIAFHFPKA